MRILVDADACPAPVKDVLYRAAERVRRPLVLVTSQMLRLPPSPCVTQEVVAAGPDAVDDRIAQAVTPEDLVVTADIPLADRVVAAGAIALDPRGTLYTEDNVKERLATRDLLDRLRTDGAVAGGPAAFGPKDVRAFANQLDRLLARRKRKAT